MKYFYIYEKMITIYKRVGMGLVIDELNPSPNPYPQKITRMKEGFPKEKEREIFFFFLLLTILFLLFPHKNPTLIST